MEIVLENLKEVIREVGDKPESMVKELSELIYARFVQDHPNHPLVRLKVHINLEKLAKKCGDYRRYKIGKRGAKATYGIEQLCGCLFIRYLYGWSYQTTSSRLVSDLILRYFCGFKLFESTPSASTIRRFEEWVKKNNGRLWFDEILRITDELFPEERTKPQYGDTFGMYSRAAKMTHNAMMRDAARRLLDALAVTHSEEAQLVCSTEQREAIFGASDALKEERLVVEKRKKLELCTAEAAYLLLKRLKNVEIELSASNRPFSQIVQKWQAVLDKILHDSFEFTPTKAGDVSIKPREKAVRGSYQLGSTIDLEATFRNHGKRVDFGYNINIATTDRFVREISAVTGAVPDANGLTALLTEQQKHLGVVPPKLIYDSAAGYPAYFVQVHNATNGQTQLVARLIDNTKNSGRFGPLDFILGEQGELTCPGGVVSTTPHRSGRDEGHKYRFHWEDCSGCSQMQQCRGDKVKEGNPRTVFISFHRKVQLEALAYTQTDAFKEEYKERAHVERIIAGNTRYNGARQARTYGTKNADFQAKMSGMAYNAKRLVKLLIEQEKGKNRNRGSPDG